MNSDPNKAEATIIPGLSEEESRKAAALIQRVYRGHRARRQVNGLGLDASTRWVEAVRDAQYQKTTTPKAPASQNLAAKTRWQHATQIAQRAGADDALSPTSETEDLQYVESNGDGDINPERRERLAEAAAERKRHAKMMDLPYFLEMVDQKHRYGSSLRKYHKVWQQDANTKQNFFYWLDYGDGKNVELDECSRERLEREQVRYLSREERTNYLVKVNEDGLLAWAKNGELVWTNDDLFRDSVKGIVPTESDTPTWKPQIDASNSPHDFISDSDSDGQEDESPENLEQTKDVSASAFFKHLTQDASAQARKWIFVADTSFRMYVGYKQSGAFQHSSFLHGSRILSAGQIKIKRGQLRKLSPLSGHYRPPVSSFRAFVHSLESAGADMSHVSITQSYAVLMGLNGYKTTQRITKETVKNMEHKVDKLVRPEKAKADEEAANDHSESARIEQEHLSQQQETHTNTPELQKLKSRKSRIGHSLSAAWCRVRGKELP